MKNDRFLELGDHAVLIATVVILVLLVTGVIA